MEVCSAQEQRPGQSRLRGAAPPPPALHRNQRLGSGSGARGPQAGGRPLAFGDTAQRGPASPPAPACPSLLHFVAPGP